MNCIGKHSSIASLGGSGRNFPCVRWWEHGTERQPETEARLPILLHARGQGCADVSEDVYGPEQSETGGAAERHIHYQLFCGVGIAPMHPLTNYKFLCDVFSELACGLKIQQSQEIWRSPGCRT